MRILLIHQNFPGQFRHLAPMWIEQGHRVTAVGCSDSQLFESAEWQGLRYIQYPSPADDGALTSHLVRAEQVAALLQQHELTPDVVIAHSAWGEALHLRWLYPKAKIVVLPELWGSARNLEPAIDPKAQPLDHASRCRIDQLNLLAASAIANADAAITATHQQRDSFPPLLQGAIQVIHEGVNCQALTPSNSSSLLLPDGQLLDRSDPVITFASRYLEPLRGLGPFLEALPEVLEQHPRVQVLIAGDTGNGGYGIPPRGISHRDDLLENLSSPLDPKRVHWLGRLPHAELTKLFQISRAHVYLSYPYTLSWSALEAMACGAPMISNREGPAAEVIHNRREGLLIPFRKPRRLAQAVLELLANPELGEKLGSAGRTKTIKNYSVENAIAKYQQLFSNLGLNCSPAAQP